MANRFSTSETSLGVCPALTTGASLNMAGEITSDVNSKILVGAGRDGWERLTSQVLLLT